MEKMVYLGASGILMPHPTKKVCVDVERELFELRGGPSYKRGLIYDITKDHLKIVTGIQGFIKVKDLPLLCEELELVYDEYDSDEDVIKAILWIWYTKEQRITQARGGKRHVNKDPAKEDPPIHIHRVIVEDDSIGQDEDEVADSPAIDSEPGLTPEPEPSLDAVDAPEKDEAAEEETEPDGNPPGENEYYCSECKSNHRKTSQVGQDHSKHAAPYPSE